MLFDYLKLYFPSSVLCFFLSMYIQLIPKKRKPNMLINMEKVDYY